MFSTSPLLSRTTVRLERRWSVDPEHKRFAATGILPVVWSRAVEMKTVALLQAKFLAVQTNVQFPLQNVQKLLAFVGIGLPAACIGSDPEQVRFHDGISPCQQF